MQYLDLRQEEQVSLESKSSEEVRQKKKLTRSGPLDKFQGIKLTLFTELPGIWGTFF